MQQTHEDAMISFHYGTRCGENQPRPTIWSEIQKYHISTQNKPFLEDEHQNAIPTYLS